MALLGGSYTRPGPSRCSNPPAPGTVIWWRAHGNVQRTYDSALGSGGRIKVLGVRGDYSHLLGCGGHTGHEPGSPVGVVHAADLDNAVPPPPGKMTLGQFAVWYCRSEADTTQVRFFNYDGKQYNSAGQVVDTSLDGHLHWHLDPGRESEPFDIVALYLTYLDGPTEEPDMTTLNDPTNQITVPPASGRLPATSSTGNAGLYIGHHIRRQDEDAIAFRAALAELTAQVSAVTNTILGTAQAEALREQTRDAAEAARDAEMEAREVARDAAQDDLIRAGGVDPDAFAQRVVSLVGPELAETMTSALLDAINNTRLTVDTPPTT